MLLYNRSLQNINLTNNRLRDSCALEIMRALTKNKRITNICLTGNSISLKHIRTIDKMLQANKCYLKKFALPNYKRENKRFKNSQARYTTTQEAIDRINNEYKIQTYRMADTNHTFKLTQFKESMLTSKKIEDKKNIEELLNRINSELDNIDYTFISERIHNEESIKKITQKIMETKWIIERIEKNCIVFNNYSEDN